MLPHLPLSHNLLTFSFLKRESEITVLCNVAMLSAAEGDCFAYLNLLLFVLIYYTTQTV